MAPAAHFYVRRPTDMPWYRVMVNGENFFFDVDGEPKRMGFYSARFVEASGDAEARQLAIAQIHEDRPLGAQLEEPDGLATLVIEEVYEVEPDSVPEVRGGVTLYREEANG